MIARRAIILCCIVWAILTPVYVFFRATTDQLARTSTNMGISARNEASEEPDKKQAERLRMYAVIFKSQAEEQELQASVFETVTLSSSGAILVLSLFCLFDRSEHEKKPS